MLVESSVSNIEMMDDSYGFDFNQTTSFVNKSATTTNRGTRENYFQSSLRTHFYWKKLTT